jgi:hypothetical protein
MGTTAPAEGQPLAGIARDLAASSARAGAKRGTCWATPPTPRQLTS